jgi:hypothetical protein
MMKQQTLALAADQNAGFEQHRRPAKDGLSRAEPECGVGQCPAIAPKRVFIFR